MAGNGSKNELTIGGITLRFDQEMPSKTKGGKGGSLYDPIVAAIRDHNPQKPVLLEGVKTSAVGTLKKRYEDILFETRGGKENPTVWASMRSVTAS